jgi:hypothetical protein
MCLQSIARDLKQSLQVIGCNIVLTLLIMMKTIILKRSNTFLSIPFFDCKFSLWDARKSNSDQSIRDPKSIYEL